jgi:CheY-like chemotaxis protein
MNLWGCFGGLAGCLAGDEAKALAAGCTAYVTKPFSPRALLAKVQEHLALVE